MSRLSSAAAALLCAVVLAPLAPAQVHDESVDGDLSGDPLAPTPLVFAVGSNVVSGTMVNPADTRDYITFEVPVGTRFSELNLLQFVDLPGGGPGDLSYHALDTGSTSHIPGMGTADLFLGGDHMGVFQVGFNLLQNLKFGTNGTGFDYPLGAGTYTYVIQQTGPELTGWSVEFVLETVTFFDEGCALAGALGEPELAGSGDLSAGSSNTVTLSNAAPNAPAGLFVSLASSPVAFKGGTLKPVPFTIFKLLGTNGAGALLISFSMPAGVPAGTELWIQYGIQDAGAPLGVALSNALRGVTP